MKVSFAGLIVMMAVRWWPLSAAPQATLWSRGQSRSGLRVCQSLDTTGQTVINGTIMVLVIINCSLLMYRASGAGGGNLGEFWWFVKRARQLVPYVHLFSATRAARRPVEFYGTLAMCRCAV